MIIRHPGYGCRVNTYTRISLSRAESVEHWVLILSSVSGGTYNKPPMVYHSDSMSFKAPMMFSTVKAGAAGKDNKHYIAILAYVTIIMSKVMSVILIHNSPSPMVDIGLILFACPAAIKVASVTTMTLS